MSRIVSMVVKLDNGKYRRLKLGKIRSMYTNEAYLCDGRVEPGEGDVAGPETDKPDFDSVEPEMTARGGGGEGGNGQPPACYFVNGVLICT